MKKDQSEEKYNKITQELKEEKMNWDFEDFLKKTEKTISSVPKPKGGAFPKFYLMAASFVLLAFLGIFFKYNNPKNLDEQDRLVKTEILKQKRDFGNGNEIVAVNTKDSANFVSDSLVTDSVSVSNDEDVISKILPKRGRIKRQMRPQYVQNSASEKSSEKTREKITDYNSNFVLINGQRIENEQEAIDLTKYSFRILSENVSKTVAQTEAIPHFNNDY